MDAWCTWYGKYHYLLNNLATPTQCRDYGYVDLYDLHEGDRIGLRLSQDGVLEFFVNGESQGIATGTSTPETVMSIDASLEICYHWPCMVATIIPKQVR